MSQTEVLDEIQRMPLEERLSMVEAAVRLIRETLPPAPSLTREERRRRLAASAQIALPHYLADKELTAFTALDGEDFLDYE